MFKKSRYWLEIHMRVHILFGPRNSSCSYSSKRKWIICSHYCKQKDSHRNAYTSNALTDLVNFEKLQHRPKQNKLTKQGHNQIRKYTRILHLKGLAEMHGKMYRFKRSILFGADDSGFTFSTLCLFRSSLLLSFFVQFKCLL